MPIDLDALSGHDRLTGKDLPGLDPDEWIELAKVKDYLLTSEAQASSYRLRKARTAAELAEDPFADPAEADAEDEDGPQVELRQDIWNYKTLEAHVGAWCLYKPLTEKQRKAGRAKGDPIEQTPQNKRRVFAVYGDRLMAVLNQRAGGILPPVPAKQIGPDGDKSDRQEVAGVGAAGELAG